MLLGVHALVSFDLIFFEGHCVVFCVRVVAEDVTGEFVGVTEVIGSSAV
jgi:hypothetical protein